MEREINYLVLRYLKKYLDPQDYENLKNKVGHFSFTFVTRSKLFLTFIVFA